MAFGRRQAFIGRGNGLNDGTGGAGMAAFAGNSAGFPDSGGQSSDMAGVTGGEGHVHRKTISVICRVNGVTGFT